MRDRDLARMSRHFPWFVLATLLLPAVLGTPHLVVAGRADRLLLGRSGADHVGAPGDVGDQPVCHVGPTAIPDP